MVFFYFAVDTAALDVVDYSARGYSSAGRAIRSQRIGRGFESRYLHQFLLQRRNMKLLIVCDVLGEENNGTTNVKF